MKKGEWQTICKKNSDILVNKYFSQSQMKLRRSIWLPFVNIAHQKWREQTISLDK